MSFQARQGDIFFTTVKKLPTKTKKKNDNILAYGEVTGHSHQIVSPALSELEMVTDEVSGDIFVKSLREEIKVGHDEHTTITLPANEWVKVSRQREYDPLAAEKQRRVAD
jgi:hypothetical protein